VNRAYTSSVTPTPDRTVDVPNRERPLSERGHQQAAALVPLLKPLNISAVYSSAFQRTLDTVRPFCVFADLSPIEREDLRESADKTPLDDVTDQMIGAVTSIVRGHGSENVLICTHGGCVWCTLRHFTEFHYEDYKRIRNPDMFRLVNNGGKLSLDEDFVFEIA
jgi:broad specificity phosphatase PhoE